MEKYRLSWTPGTGVTQDVIQMVPDPNDTTKTVEQVLAADLPISQTSFDQDFATDSMVEWFVQTKDPNAANGPSADSAHATFKATNQTPETVSAATGLSDQFLSHTP